LPIFNEIGKSGLIHTSLKTRSASVSRAESRS
jgi:hypothetical protein